MITGCIGRARYVAELWARRFWWASSVWQSGRAVHIVVAERGRVGGRLVWFGHSWAGGASQKYKIKFY